MYYSLPKEALRTWLLELKAAYEVIAPQDAYGFGPFEGGLYLDGKTKASAKEFFLPSREVLLSFEAHPHGAYRPAAEALAGERVVFGIRPCDAKGGALIERVFSGDPLFRQRREKTIFVGLLCREPEKTCFCWAMGVNPFAGKGLEALFLEEGDHFFVKVFNEKGRKILAFGPFEEAPEAEAHFKGAEEEFLNKYQVAPALEKLKQTELLKLYEAAFWEELALPCLNCGTCTFLCPTCYCFDVQDEVVGSEGVRVRLPDACMFELYSRHASGHNPRRSPVARFRNRFLHKFKYFLDQYGEPLCVGCGRCNEECPAGVDLWEIIRAMSMVS